MIDSHLHVWDPARHEYPWLAAEPELNRAFLPSDLDLGGHEIDGVVVVEAGCRSGPAELGWLEHLAATWPDLLGIVAQVPLEQGRSVAPLLAEAAARPLTAGVRRNVQDEPPGFMLAESMLAGVRLLQAYDLPFDACVREHQLEELVELVDRCPQVTFVLDHLGKPAIGGQRRQPWFDRLATLARRPNVVVKLSGLTTEADHAQWRPADIAPYLSHAVEQFGPDRCMFGSDWPVATLATTYARWVDLVLDAIAGLAGDERASILAGTAARIYRLSPRKQEGTA